TIFLLLFSPYPNLLSGYNYSLITNYVSESSPLALASPFGRRGDAKGERVSLRITNYLIAT
ncbi:hypothetical protein, partial [Nostoc sp. NMS7]|uniref:hypothetical protein n=1 Tax=Nostoc sp. NMS7 TaxID=2815391 RepID=UPI0025EFCA27